MPLLLDRTALVQTHPLPGMLWCGAGLQAVPVGFSRTLREGAPHLKGLVHPGPPSIVSFLALKIRASLFYLKHSGPAHITGSSTEWSPAAASPLSVLGSGSGLDLVGHCR
eukprot:scaffold79844_cov15-Tisochrysis_lutea.AAC.1